MMDNKALPLACITLLWIGGILVASLAAADRPTEIRFSVSASQSAELEAAKPSAGSPFAGTNWRLVYFQSMDDAIGTLRPDDPSRYTMRLKGDGTVTMRLNCNRASGTWSVKPSGSGDSGRFEFGALATTRALCPPPSLDAKIAAHAQYIRSYLIQDGRLYLSLMADGGIYAWEPYGGKAAAESVPAAPADGGPRNWKVVEISGTLNLRAQPSTRAKIIDRFTAGTLVDNLGCQRAEGRIWCDVQPLGGGTRGYVAAAFLKAAVSPDGKVATGPDDSARRAGQGEFDATGHIACAQAAGQPMTQCEFGIARAGGGYATIVVKRPDERNRAIFFRMGRAIGADIGGADGAPVLHATKENNLHLIRLGNERYEIPDAVLF